MSDVLNAQWLAFRSVRSTFWLLVSLVVVLAGAWAAGTVMIGAWDAASPADQANFESADMSVIVGPLVQLVLAILGALVITAEYRTGSIGTTLTAVPNRLRLLAAKALVVAGASGAVAVVVALVTTGLSLQLAGDRPPPIEPWTSTADAVSGALAGIAVAVSAALVGLGLGAALRSSAGAVTAIAGLLFVAPVLAVYLPDPWDERIFGLLPSSLAGQLAGDSPYALGAVGAAVALVAYPAVALAAGAVVLLRRDA